MGIWGPGLLENDAALDWLGEFECDLSVGVLESTLAVVADALPDFGVDDDQGDYVEADEASCSLAAAEIIANALGRSGPDLSDELLLWIDRHRAELSVLAPLAAKAVRRVLDSSELSEIWAETDDFAEWCGVLNELIIRLQVASA